jgi:hypothetical protein
MEPLPGPLPPPPASYVEPTRDTLADRSGYVMAAGITMIVLGGFAAIGGLLSMLWIGVVMSAMAKGIGVKDAGSVGAIIMVAMAIIYLAPAANLLVCGIGSLRFRPWARMATVVSSAIWLGLVGLLFGTLIMAAVFGPRGGMGLGAGETIIMAVVYGVMGIFVLALPILLLVLYCRKDVKATFAGRSVRV